MKLISKKIEVEKNDQMVGYFGTETHIQTGGINRPI